MLKARLDRVTFMFRVFWSCWLVQLANLDSTSWLGKELPLAEYVNKFGKNKICCLRCHFEFLSK